MGVQRARRSRPRPPPTAPQSIAAAASPAITTSPSPTTSAILAPTSPTPTCAGPKTMVPARTACTNTSPFPAATTLTTTSAVSPRAIASSDVTPTSSAPVASAMPFAVASAMRVPVKLPGPMPTAHLATSAGFHPTRWKRASSIGSRDSPCAFETRCASSATRSLPSKRATDPSAVEVSMAARRMTTWRSIRRSRCERSAARAYPTPPERLSRPRALERLHPARNHEA